MISTRAPAIFGNQAKTQEFYGNSSPNFAKNSIFRQVQSPTMPKKWPKKKPVLVLTDDIVLMFLSAKKQTFKKRQTYLVN